MLTVSNDYAVGCLYFICAGSSGNKVVIHSLAKKDSYFELSIIEGLKLKIVAGGASGKMDLYQIAPLQNIFIPRYKIATSVFFK